jgi:hypothetical protein
MGSAAGNSMMAGVPCLLMESPGFRFSPSTLHEVKGLRKESGMLFSVLRILYLQSSVEK